MVRIIAADLLRTAMLPLQTGALIAAGILHGRRRAGDRRLLKNTEHEYTITARALATSQAGQNIAEQAHDQATADLLASLRRQDEQLLQTLADSVAEQARAIVAAQAGGQQTARTAADTVRQMPGATRTDQETQAATTRGEDLPVLGYRLLNATDITPRLRMLSQTDLAVIEGYERAHANRPGVLSAIEQLRGSEPWPGYDTMNPGQINARVQTADPAVARQVMDYERRHRQRQTVITTARQRTGT
jgi:hypothetical protein